MGAPSAKQLLLVPLLALLPACSEENSAGGIDAGSGTDTGSDTHEDCPPPFECVPEFECAISGGVAYDQYFCGAALVCCEMPADTASDSETGTGGDTDVDSDTDVDTDADTDTGSETSTECVDEDSDDWCLPFDCDDGDPDVNPSVDEVPDNGIDDDCDGITDDDADTDTCTLQADTDFDTDSSAYLCLADAGPATCEPVAGDFGDCEQPLGFGLDGMRCEMVEGCDCGVSEVVLYESAVGCATACGAEGHCNLCAFSWLLPSCDMEGDWPCCDDVFVCIAPEYTDLLESLFAGITCDDEPIVFCSDGSVRCNTEYGGFYVTEEQWTELRVISLLPMVSKIVFMIYE